MLYIILFIISVIIGGYFAFRYFSLVYAIKKITMDIEDIQQDLTQNQILHLPIPNNHLGKLLCALNDTLDGIRKERQKYEKREKEFQKQIENISHDLRTPLTVILGYLKLSKFSKSNIEIGSLELKEILDIIKQKAEVMKSLVTQFYDFSRLNAGDYELLLSDVDISRTLRESLMGNYQVLEQAHLKIDVDIPQRPIWGLSEKTALERIFLNLFQNVIRYADTYLAVSIREDKQHIVVSFVNDTHVLSEYDIHHLFDRFYMQDNSRNQGGTGLGLTVAKNLAEEMNGTLDVRTIEDDSSDKEKILLCFELSIKLI